MKKRSRSLTLTKETLRTLDPLSLADAEGGSIPPNTTTAALTTIAASPALGRGLTPRCVVLSGLCA